jgi:hypothetical protein
MFSDVDYLRFRPRLAGAFERGVHQLKSQAVLALRATGNGYDLHNKVGHFLSLNSLLFVQRPASIRHRKVHGAME